MMPMPTPAPMGPEPGAGGGAPLPPGAGAEGGNPEQVKGQLIILLQKAKEVADANGVDWNSVLAEIEGNKAKADVPLPRPPSPGR